MKTIILGLFCLVTFAGGSMILERCSAVTPIPRKLWGCNRPIDQELPELFVANYVQYGNSKHGKYLPSPMIFKMNHRRTRLYVVFGGKTFAAEIVDVPSRMFVGVIDGNLVYYRVFDGYITLKTAGTNYTILRKTMI